MYSKGKGAEISFLHSQEMCGDVTVLAQIWRPLGFGLNFHSHEDQIPRCTKARQPFMVETLIPNNFSQR
ncbi:hypothetical protein NE237_032895 [Protea cynaroides]|uniref:Uncharacterized protein n=1 Tax=Protea cynaroides TaxID=273540 RepID=A0A9Q0L3W1_9MAGN|nr:hypothetical protein NE237_032895 [Protea cynaroides]